MAATMPKSHRLKGNSDISALLEVTGESAYSKYEILSKNLDVNNNVDMDVTSIGL